VTRRAHVLIVSDWYPSPENPAAATFVRDQALAVARLCDVTVIAPPSDRAPADSIEDGLRILRFRRARGARWMVRWSMLRELDAAVVRLRRERKPPDIIHAHVFSTGFLAVLVGRRRRLGVVVSEHLSDVLEERVAGWDATIARFTYRHADLVCPVSSVLEDKVLRLEPRAKCAVVDNVVDIDLFANAAQAVRGSNGQVRETNGQRLLVVARLVGKKGVHDLLIALRRLVADGRRLTLDVLGDGPERSRLEALARGLPVRFMGARPRADVAAQMRQVDLLVVPSLVETFGITAIEGLAAGLRVVVTSPVPVADVVAECGGIVTEPGNPTALTDALRKALDAPDETFPPELDALRARFGPEALAARWQSIYEPLLAKGTQTAYHPE